MTSKVEEEKLLESLLKSTVVTNDEILAWLLKSSCTSAFRDSSMVALRMELNLVVANFVRERAQPYILWSRSGRTSVVGTSSSSSSLLLTPSRDSSTTACSNNVVSSTDKRYEYTSPLKRITSRGEKTANASNECRRKSKRIQLFSQPESYSSSPSLASSSSTSSEKSFTLIQQEDESRKKGGRPPNLTLSDFLVVKKDVKSKKAKGRKRLVDDSRTNAPDNQEILSSSSHSDHKEGMDQTNARETSAIEINNNKSNGAKDKVGHSNENDLECEKTLTVRYETSTTTDSLKNRLPNDDLRVEMKGAAAIGEGQNCQDEREGLSDEARSRWNAFVQGFDRDDSNLPATKEVTFSAGLSTPNKEVGSISGCDCKALDRLALLYSYYINNCSLPSIMAELDILVELVLLKEKRKSEDVNLCFLWPFESAKTCVYFASRVLQELNPLLLQYQHPTLLRLLESPLGIQSAKLRSKIDHLHCTKNDSTSWKPSKSDDIVIKSVHFNSERDGKATFPDDRTFRDFRKQRDNFYALLRHWQINDNDSSQDYGPASNFNDEAARFCNGVRNEVLNVQRHPVNMAHFSRLFRDQMLTMASLLFFETMDDDLEKRKDERLRRLETRFHKTTSTFKSMTLAGDNDESDSTAFFPGSLRFFYDFVVVSNDHVFLTHLKALLINFLDDEHEAFQLEEQNEVNMDVRRNIVSTLIRLKVAARMLSLIITLPFSCTVKEGKQLQQIATPCSQANTATIESLRSILKHSVENQDLLKTLPWLTDFLCLLDNSTMNLPATQSLLKSLVKIYTGKLLKKYKMSESNAFFVLICLGRLFENPTVPRELFLVQEGDDEEDTDDGNGDGLKRMQEERKALLERRLGVTKGIDTFDVLPISFLHHSCQDLATRAEQLYLSSSNVLPRSTFAAQSHLTRRINVSDEGKSGAGPQMLKERTLQSQLETNFFHNQSQSILKSVDFVSDRIASKWIRAVNKSVIKQAHSEAAFLVAEIVLSYSTDTDRMKGSSSGCEMGLENNGLNGDERNCKVDMEKKMEDEVFHLIVQRGVLASFLGKVRSSSFTLFEAEFSSMCESGLHSLLPVDDMNPQVVDVAIKIALNKAKSKGEEWINAHVTQEFAEQSLRQEVVRQTLLLAAGKSDQLVMMTMSYEDTTSKTLISDVDRTNEELNEEDRVWPSEVMMKLKSSMKLMLLGQPRIQTVADAEIVLKELEMCVATNKMSDLTLRTLAVLSVEWLLVTMTFEPRSLSSSLVSSMVSSLWTVLPLSSSAQQQLLMVLSPKNLVLLNRSKEPQLSWLKFEMLLTNLLVSGLVPPLVFEQQCLSILRCQWPQFWLTRLASCLRGVVDEWRQKQKCTTAPRMESEFVELVEWIAWICAEAIDEESSNEIDFAL